MKRDDLVRKIAEAAMAQGTTFVVLREGGNHTVFRYGSQNVVIPRHREINELTARAILRDLGVAWRSR